MWHRNILNKKHEPVTCFSALSCEVPIKLSFNIKIAMKSIIMNASMHARGACPGAVWLQV
jgi:hypothetical protein